MEVDKVGVTTGWTTGTLDDDCNDEYAFNHGMWFRVQIQPGLKMIVGAEAPT
jgi:hypothetical protein